jgi:hypothetical protein
MPARPCSTAWQGRASIVQEKKRLQFRAEVFNLTNTPSFDVPGRTLGSSTFGVVTATTSPTHVREMQLALQLLF